jgi:hypothetical protein
MPRAWRILPLPPLRELREEGNPGMRAEPYRRFPLRLCASAVNPRFLSVKCAAPRGKLRFMPQSGQVPDEPPPFLGSWRRVYIAVIVYLALIIAGFFLFTRAYQ